jgi:hypothetical protein
MTVHHWGEDPHGLWTLSILDVPQKREQPRNGILKKWELELHGTEFHPQSNWMPPAPIPVPSFTRHQTFQDNQPESILNHSCREVKFIVF